MNQTKPKTGIPLRALLAIGAGVLLVHALLLRALPAALPTLTPPPVRALTTRTVALESPAPAPAPAPRPAPVAAKPPKPSPKPPRPAVAKPQPTDTSSIPTTTTTTTTASETIAAGPGGSPELASPPAAVAAKPQPEPAPEAPPPPVPPPREALTGPAGTLSIPSPVRIHYDVSGEAKRLSYSARAQLLWLQDGANYDAVLEVSAFLVGAFSQMSSGQITAEGLAPMRFADKRRSEVAAHFERDKGKVTFSANTPDAPLLAGAQDRLSVILQLVAMLAGDPGQYPPATTITLPIVGPRDAEVWLFTVEGEETLYLPKGQMQAIRISRNPRREFDQKIEVWFAPSLAYMPVRVKITQANGDFVDQKMIDVEKP